MSKEGYNSQVVSMEYCNLGSLQQPSAGEQQMEDRVEEKKVIPFEAQVAELKMQLAYYVAVAGDSLAQMNLMQELLAKNDAVIKSLKRRLQSLERNVFTPIMEVTLDHND